MLFGLYPIWWAMGLGEVIWPLVGAGMALSLLTSRSVAIPRFASIWVLFCVVVAASGFLLEEQRDVWSWIIRLSQYVSAGLTVPYILTHRRSTPAHVVFASISVLFCASVVGGYIGLLLGDLSFRSPFAYVLPGGFQSNSFVSEVVNPSFADVERFLGRFSVTRPKAPFTYTNSWGAAMALLFPFGLHDALHGFGISKRVARIAVGASAVPIALSLNQGLWVSLIAGAGFLALRSAGRGDVRLILQLLALALVVAVAITATPLGNTFRSELQNPNATEDRFELYQATLNELPKSPIIGFGGPRVLDDGLALDRALFSRVRRAAFVLRLPGRHALVDPQLPHVRRTVLPRCDLCQPGPGAVLRTRTATARHHHGRVSDRDSRRPRPVAAEPGQRAASRSSTWRRSSAK